jgi:hypothetical protein
MDEKAKLYGETATFPAKWGYGAGISKREYFAGLFMQALIANPERWGVKFVEIIYK